MRVLVYAYGQDTGGQGFRIEEAFRRHAPEHDLVSRNGIKSELRYPETFTGTIMDRMREAKARYDEADVVHLRNALVGWQRWDAEQAKPVILHHHGSMFRRGHAHVAAQARRVGATQIAATLDLTLLQPDVAWLPSPYPVDEMAAKRVEHDGPVRIGYFPTNPKWKSLHPFLAAFDRLKAKRSVELVSNIFHRRIQRIGWDDVLRRKATCDILFDQVILGYGNNTLEAWCYGIPVIAGTQDKALRQAMVERFGSLPYVEATEQTIYDALERLVDSRAMREEYGQKGQEHARRFHDYSVVVPQLVDLYQSAQPSIPQYISARTGRSFSQGQLVREQRREAIRKALIAKRDLRRVRESAA